MRADEREQGMEADYRADGERRSEESWSELAFLGQRIDCTLRP
jgi:hypothetical protein